jgi:hypothetical protein
VSIGVSVCNSRETNRIFLKLKSPAAQFCASPVIAEKNPLPRLHAAGSFIYADALAACRMNSAISAGFET